ncbi:agamous-like MADS-box protein AGL29 [Lycium ferocissimum]|uniref:agamous-like MADS-box protein AGL29 n=1 Tax=Lycium ferocissimum TaxID=112874 RepID=UPI002814FD17|nr:agamous-like MADS-box protein AGL29 [Lycium ferocissimum]
MERKSFSIRKNIEVQFIKDKRAEHAKISKMQKALCKKANELSILCGIEIAIIIFSVGGQPFLFGNPDVESVVHQFLEANQPTASPSSRYIMKKRKKEERENKGKDIDQSEDFKMTDLEKFEKLNQEIEKFEDYLIKEIAEQQSAIGSEYPEVVLEMNATSSLTLLSNWLSL